MEKAHTVIHGFEILGMSLPIDGSLDCRLKVKGLTGLEIGDWSQGIENTALEDENSELDEAMDSCAGWEYDHRD